ncbi:hypothetical protein DACRYDRAFT_108797 [Dacryopinax primogenitus]|uniref:F-box domain-containing protein n=1 Tax=Dacryopinax primogenitus (strain DJM 731) TaxID=1858805 RepID=M5FWI5_DACPD|nr:uncharacterized protein DACRYDRAFT_108797 [Dacryopinax primogenitus]EJU00734.1 hypothetical protein DACRYDRAFT_108797 [Dacryopinax primogenitus]
MASTQGSTAMPRTRTRAASLPAYMRTALAFLPIRSLGKTPQLVDVVKIEANPLPIPIRSVTMPPTVDHTSETERTMLAAEIEDLRRQMDALSSQLREKQIRLMRLASYLPDPPSLPIFASIPTSSFSPLRVQNFPPEILQNIFHHVVLSHPSARITLSQVCFYWRNCALSCPSLWSEITIPVRPSYTEGFVNTTTVAFQRAKASELRLHLTYELSDSVASSSITGPDYRLLDLALSRQHLWGTLELDVRDQLWTAPILDRLVDGLDGAHCPKLRAIDWKTGMKASPKFDLLLSRLLAGSNNLQRLSLQSHVDLVLPKPIPSLKSLVLQLGQRPPITQLRLFLQGLRGLVELTLPALDHEGPTPASPNGRTSTICLLELATLTIDITDDAADARFLRELDLPALNTLVLRPEDNVTAEHVHRVVQDRGWLLGVA